MEGVLEVNIGVDTVVLNAIKLTSDEWNWIVSLPYELVDAYVATYGAVRRLNSFPATS